MEMSTFLLYMNEHMLYHVLYLFFTQQFSRTSLSVNFLQWLRVWTLEPHYRGSNPISVINYLGNPRQGVLPECLYFLWLWNGGGTLNTCLPTLEDELVSHKISAVTMGISHTHHYSYCCYHHHYSASIHTEFLHLFFFLWYQYSIDLE